MGPFFARIILCCVLLCASLASSVQAQVYRIQWPPFPTANVASSTNAGQLWSADIRYDTQRNFMYVYLHFAKINGIIPNSFHLVANDGPNPRGFPGEFAIFYFDASNAADPKLTVYGYNGMNAIGYSGGMTQSSWYDGAPAAGNQTPDFIISSVTDRSFVHAFYYQDFPNGARSLGFAISLNRINSYVPINQAGVPWKGFRFGNQIGLWLGIDYWVTSSYNPNGSLHHFKIERLGYFDTHNTPAIQEPPPVCNANNPTFAVLQPNQPYTANISAFDPQNQNIYTIHYSGLPPGSTVNPANGTVLNFSSSATATFSWTPTAANIGQSYTVNVDFTDVYSGWSRCPLTVTVAGSNPTPPPTPPPTPTPPPNCVQQPINKSELDQGTQLSLDIVKRAARKLKAVTGSLTVEQQKLLGQAKTTHIKAWQAINALPDFVLDCPAALQCVTASLEPTINLYRSASSELTTHAVQFDNWIATALRKKTNKLTVKTGNFDKKAQRQDLKNQELALAIPATNDVCS